MSEKTRMDECPNRTVVDFWTDSAESFSTDDLENFESAIAEWSELRDLPYAMAKTDKGFEVHIGHFTFEGHEFATDLFVSLRSNFRVVGKIVFYDIRETVRSE